MEASMRKTFEDGLTHDQLRRIDRWMLVSLASVIAASLLIALLFGGNTSARRWSPQEASNSDARQLAKTSPARNYRSEAVSRNLIGQPHASYHAVRPDGALRAGEQRQGLPIVY
jgi:hypothetical protein